MATTTTTPPSTSTNASPPYPTPPSHPYTYTLYTFFNSSCSARVRIYAHLRHIPLTYHYIDLLTSQQSSPAYTTLNPSQFVPLLVVSDRVSGAEKVRITQSIAIMEFFEETWPLAPFLLPPRHDPLKRAKVRELVGVIACDTQPPTNQRIVKYIKPRGLDEFEWQGHFMSKGLSAFNELARGSAGKWSVGDEMTLADVCLMPAVDRARRYKVEMGGWEVVGRVVEGMTHGVEAYRRGRPGGQEDAPEGVREKL